MKIKPLLKGGVISLLASSMFLGSTIMMEHVTYNKGEFFMKIKTALLTALTAFAVCLSVSGVSADDSTIISDEEAAGIVANIERYNKMLAEDSNIVSYAVSPSIEDTNPNSNSEDYFTGFDFEISGYDMSNAYKMYILKSMIITEYKENPDFMSLIEGEPRFMLPADGKLVTFRKEGSSYRELGTQYTTTFFDFKGVTRNALDNINEEVLNIIHTYSFDYYMDIIYIETAQNEYAIPFFDLIECLDPGDRIISGALYTLDEFMDRMDQTYVEDNQPPYDENGMALIGGGVSLRDDKPADGSQDSIEKIYAEIAAAASANHNNMDNKETNIFSYILLAVAALVSLSFIAAIIVFNRKKHAYSK